jgi:hypothetical protein
MDYKLKYLKYKQKYLQLKKLYGGFTVENPMPIPTRLNIKRVDDLIYINNTNINLISNNDHILVPMNSYEVVDKNNEDIFSTVGIQDCVGVAIYNKKYGRYFAHYLRFNEFCEDLTNACEVKGNNIGCEMNATSDYPHPGIDCDNGSIKIKNSIPSWVKETGTIIHIFSQADHFKIISRYNQLNRIILENKGLIINLYFNKVENGEEGSFNFLGAERDRIVDRLKQVVSRNKGGEQPEIDSWDDTLQIYTRSTIIINNKIFLFDKNGKIFVIKDFDDLRESRSLYNFYDSISVKRFTSFHNSKKCVKRYSLKKSFYESNKRIFDEKDSIPNKSVPPMDSKYHQSIFHILNGET